MGNITHFSHCTLFSASRQLENITCSKTNNAEHKPTVKTKASKLETIISEKRTAFLTLQTVFSVVQTPTWWKKFQTTTHIHKTQSVNVQTLPQGFPVTNSQLSYSTSANYFVLCVHEQRRSDAYKWFSAEREQWHWVVLNGKYIR